MRLRRRTPKVRLYVRCVRTEGRPEAALDLKSRTGVKPVRQILVARPAFFAGRAYQSMPKLTRKIRGSSTCVGAGHVLLSSVW